jgi:hypothetical protein
MNLGHFIIEHKVQQLSETLLQKHINANSVSPVTNIMADEQHSL